MAKILTSAIGILFLNPAACGGSPVQVDSNTGGSLSAGGSTSRTECNTSAECKPDETCHQVLFPIMPPQGVDAGPSVTKLGECVPKAGAGGAGNTGGTGNAGGNQSTGGASSKTRCNIITKAPCASNEVCRQVLFPIMPPEGFDGGISGEPMLGECYPAQQSLNDNPDQIQPADDDAWWQAAEAALRRT